MATSFADGKKFYIDPAKLLPLERFLPKPKGAPSARGGALVSLSFLNSAVAPGSLSLVLIERLNSRRAYTTQATLSVIDSELQDRS